MIKVFISYSHDSPEHADRVLIFSNRLIDDGIDCILDQYEDSPPEGWPKWMDRQIETSDFILVICTETYYLRVMGTEEEGKGLGVRWESTLTYQHIYDAGGENTRFIPVLFQSEKIEHIPKPLRGVTHYYIDTEEGYEDLYRRLTNQPKTKKPELGKLRKLPPRKRKQNFFATEIMLSKLPTTGSELFGREKELKFLDEAWTKQHAHILTLVAWGGVGKTALVNEWLNQMELDNYRGAERVYGWSFYSQGTGEDKQASGDTFIEDALRWFGYEGGPLKSPWDKGVRLAEMIRKQKTLLILDGLEPLQYPPGEMGGHLKDQGLQALLKELARSNPGLCIISTRLQIKDIEHALNSTVINIPLENLLPEAGAHLLKSLGVKGTSAELQNAADEFKGHALALNLLGSYLTAVHDGEVRKRDLIPHLTEEEEQGGHGRRVMESYKRWLKGKPELDILYLMGLFDRPPEGGAIDTLRAEPPIEGLTSELQNLSDVKWQYAVKHLRDLRLLAEKDGNRPDTLDCHPLVREHFGEKLQKNNPAAWKETHNRLYEFYKTQAPEHPDTLQEMETLFSAVAHGCQAGRHQETMDDVFYKRIDRGNAFVAKYLGAFSATLSAISGFFNPPWHKPVHGLNDLNKAYILNVSGCCLRALGRLQEAAQPMQAGLEDSVSQENWKEAARNSGNLSELYLTLGKVKQAVDFAQQSVEFADRSGDGFQKESKRTALADALHQAGELPEADSLFREAETMQKKRQPEYAYLYSLQGFQFCDLLLSQRLYQEVQKRASQTLELAQQSTGVSILDIAVIYLSLGLAHLLQTLGRRNKRFHSSNGLPESGGGRLA